MGDSGETIVKSETENAESVESSRLRFGGAGFGAALGARLVLNTARRFPYPFAPALSRGLDVPLTSVTAILGANQFSGLSCLVFGPLGDRLGYRTLMLAGLATLVAGLLLAGGAATYPAVFVGLVLAGLAKNMYDPAVLAFTGRAVPYERRGRAVGLLEMSWAGSSLAGLPLVGRLMDRFGWRAPFFVLAALAAVALFVLARRMPPEIPPPDAPPLAAELARIRERLRKPAALGALGFAMFFNGANDLVFVVSGLWLEGDFGLSLSGLGLAAAVIGAAELCGEGLVAAVADRLGIPRAVAMGAFATAAAYGILPFLGGRLSMVLGGYFLAFLTAEFTIVASLTLFTELMPEARGTLMAGYLAGAGIGRFLGALSGGLLWNLGGVPAVAAAAAAMALSGFVALRAGMARARQSAPSISTDGDRPGS
jgi:MFS transporter, DHA1 family, inner membrane transport protein